MAAKVKLYEVTERLPDGREREVVHPVSRARLMTLSETTAAAKSAHWAVTIKEVPQPEPREENR